MQVKGTEQIEEDSRAPNDHHYLMASAAGQGKGQNPDFLSAPGGVRDADDLMNMMLGITSSGPQPSVQYSKSKDHTTQQKMQVKKEQVRAQGVRASAAYAQADSNAFDPFSNLPSSMREMLDPFYTSTNNQAIHFKGNSLNPESHYYPQGASTPGEGLNNLAHLDLSDWGRSMPSGAGHPSVGQLLMEGARWEYNRVVGDINDINNGNFKQRVSGFVSLVGDVTAAASVVMPVAEGMMLMGRAVAGEVGNAVRALGIFRQGARVVDNAAMAETPIIEKHPLAGLSPQNVVRLADELGLETPRNHLILWSGLGRGDAGVRLSQEFARVNGGMTLEMTPGGKWLEEMDLFGLNSPFSQLEARKIWQGASVRMIQQASGQVRSIVGTVNPNSIYRAEQIELHMNTNILGLDELNLKPRYGFN